MSVLTVLCLQLNWKCSGTWGGHLLQPLPWGSPGGRMGTVIMSCWGRAFNWFLLGLDLVSFVFQRTVISEHPCEL